MSILSEIPALKKSLTMLEKKAAYARAWRARHRAAYRLYQSAYMKSWRQRGTGFQPVAPAMKGAQ